jgi:hypothetical protein
MTIQQAYKYAIELPIKDLPNIQIVAGETVLYLKEIFENSSIELRDADDEKHFSIRHADLMSENWEVVVINE